MITPEDIHAAFDSRQTVQGLRPMLPYEEYRRLMEQERERNRQRFMEAEL